MSRTMKRHDTLDPFTGFVRVNGARINLNQFSAMELHYKLKTNPVDIIVLVAIDVEAVDGPGGPNEPDGFPPNRGKWRAVQVDADVDTAGEYEVELECVTAGGKKVHFPSARADNETLAIDPDVDDT